MNTDNWPRSAAKKTEYERSDAMHDIKLPLVELVRPLSQELELALKQDSRKDVQRISNKIAAVVATAFDVKVPRVKVLGARPREVTEKSEYELFGDYDFDTSVIRLWMRTSVMEKTTSFGTLLSTLCHELCHHLDVVKLSLPNTFHTRGFYERAGILYHHVRGTPRRQLVWAEQRGGTYRINWPQTMKGRPLHVAPSSVAANSVAASSVAANSDAANSVAANSVAASSAEPSIAEPAVPAVSKGGDKAAAKSAPPVSRPVQLSILGVVNIQT